MPTEAQRINVQCAVGGNTEFEFESTSGTLNVRIVQEREDYVRVSILLSEHMFLVSIKSTLKCMVAAQAIDWGRVRNFGGKIGLEGHCPAASPSTSFTICMMG